MDLGVADVHVDTAPSKRPLMSKYTCDDSLDSKDACAKAMKRCMDAQASKADDDDDEAFDFAKKKIEAAMKLFDDDGDSTAMDDGDSTAMSATVTCRGESFELAAKSADEKQVWIQVAKPGKFSGHVAGAFEMNARTFAEIIHNFSAQKNRAIPIDFEHASEQAPTSGSIPTMGAPAQGWITKLELRADGNLWGLCSWGDLAKKYIRAGQYKFLSPAIVFGSKDRVTGKTIGARLSSVALTNSPFLDGMQPIAAKHVEASKVDVSVLKIVATALALPAITHDDARFVTSSLKLFQQSDSHASTIAAALRESLRLPITMTLADVFATARIACGEILLSNVSPPIPAAHNPQPPVSASHEESRMGDQNKEKELETQVSQLTLKLNATESEKKQLLSDHEVKIVTLTAENEGLKKLLNAHDEREVTAAVETAIQVWGEKKGLTAESRPHLMRFAKNDREGFMALYPSVPAGQRHLGQTIASGGHQVPGQALPVNEIGNVIRLRDVISDAEIPSTETIATRFMSEAKAAGGMMSREEAFAKAHAERTNLINKAANKRLSGTGV